MITQQRTPEEPGREATREQRAVAESLLSALARRDFHALAACFSEDAQFRALTPSGLREATSGAGAAAHLERWFGEADQHELLEGHCGVMADRLFLLYRLQVHNAKGWQIVEQQAYCDVRDGQIERMDLLCSGFRRVADN